jgi:hypothetical protein
MKKTPQQVINEILPQWSRDFIKNRAQDARDADLSASGKLIRSFGQQVNRSDAQGRASAFISFRGYGRILDMRQRQPNDKQMPIEPLKSWIIETGIEQFKSKFANKYRLPTDNRRLVTQLAWAIAKKRQKRRRKRRRWYSKNRERDINILYRSLLEGYQDSTLNSMKDELEEG